MNATREIPEVGQLRPYRHSTYGTRQWCAVDNSGQRVEFEYRTPEGDFRGYRIFFQRKRDVLEAIRGLR